MNVKSWAGKFSSNHAITIFPFYADELKKGFCVSVATKDHANKAHYVIYAKFEATYIDVPIESCMVRIALEVEENDFKTVINSVTSDPTYSIDIENIIHKRSNNPSDPTGHLVLPYGDGINVVHILPLGGKNTDTNYANHIYVIEDGVKASGAEINDGSCPVITNGKEPQKILCAWQDDLCVAQLDDPDYEYQ